jgi:hypothetical protein|tara:strand:+ start:5577 stop:6287 length:711 start_codon:yes stop_codon:yes gene_type:complete
VIKNNHLTYEKYSSLKRSNRLSELAFHKSHIHQSLCRYALVDNLVEDFPYDYWVVITFGFFPQFSDCEVVLSNAHYRLDRWLLNNLKLKHLRIDQRSKWICLPEKGSGHLHFNCFIKLGERPNVTHIGRNGVPSEWLTMKDVLKRTFSAVEKMMGWNDRTIQFSLHDRRDNNNALRQAIYSTQEMRTGWMEQNNEDHFADMIMSWKHFNVKPINFRSPKFLKRRPKSTGDLSEFMK